MSNEAWIAGPATPSVEVLLKLHDLKEASVDWILRGEES